MTKDKDKTTFEEFEKIVSQLEPQARRDVLDYAVFLIWLETRDPAPVGSLVRGGVLYLTKKLSGGKL